MLKEPTDTGFRKLTKEEQEEFIQERRELLIKYLLEQLGSGEHERDSK